MPLKNLNEPVRSRRALDTLMQKSQLWAGFLITALIFLIGFFQNTLASVQSLLFAIGASLFLFVAAMELANYSDFLWEVSVIETLYYWSCVILFGGVFYYVENTHVFGTLSYFFLVPSFFYFFMWFLALRIAMTIYRQPPLVSS